MSSPDNSGTALAGGAVAVALLETLIDKGMLTTDEGKDVFRRAAILLTSVHSSSSEQALKFFLDGAIGKNPKGR